MTDGIMIDPSLLLHQATFPAVRDTAEELESPLWISHTLFLAITEPTVENRLSQFVEPPEAVDLSVVADLLERPNVKPYAGRSIDGTEIDYESFVRLTQDPFVASLLHDEWSFMLSHSWLVARTKQALAAFKNAGGAAVEITEQTFDALVRRTLKVPEPLTAGQRLRGASKWIAGGGAPLTPLLGPAGIALGVGLGIFLVIDP
jgi:hypothetical protein